MNITDSGYKTVLYSPVFSRLLIAAIILLIGIIIGRITGNIVYRLLHEINLNAVAKKTTKVKFSLERGISNLICYFIYFVTVIIMLSNMGLPTTILNIIIASILVIFVIVTFLVLNYFLPSIVAGIFIRRKSFLKEGDDIKFGDKEGTIQSINMIETLIKTKNGDAIYIPNSLLAKKEITKIKVKK